MTVTSHDGPPSLHQAATELGVGLSDLDESFGVVPIDEDQGTYCVEVDAERLPQDLEKKVPYKGPYSNPRIEHFGPIQSSDKK